MLIGLGLSETVFFRALGDDACDNTAVDECRQLDNNCRVVGPLVRSPFGYERSLAPKPGEAIFFLPSIIRIPRLTEKSANFPGVEVASYEQKLLWVSGGNLTKAADG